MNTLKIVLSILLALVLFVCLALTGAAVTVNATALNPGFMTGQVDRLDIAALFDEEAVPKLEEQSGLAGHPEIISGIQAAVENEAPALKSAADEAISEIYAYLLHGGTLDLRQTLKDSVFNPQLAVSIINSLDLRPFISGLLLENVPLEVAQIAGSQVDLRPYADAVANAIQPWFKQQMELLVPRVYDYVLGYNATLDFTIPVTDELGNIGAALKTALLASPPPVLAGLSQVQLSADFDVAWAAISAQVPPAIALDSAQAGIEVPPQAGQSLDDARNGLANARQAIAYYRGAFWGLAALMVLLVAGIALINRRLKTICLVLGSVFAVYGITELFGVIISRGLAHSRLMALPNTPQALRPWLVQLTDAASNPLLIFSAGFLALGAILLVAALLYRRGGQEYSPLL